MADVNVVFRARAVIFDCDGVLLDTERMVHEVCASIVTTVFHKTYEPERFTHLLGRAPRESVRLLIEGLELPCTVDEYLALAQPKLVAAWARTAPIAGAPRLVEHLAASGVPIALATSSDRPSLVAKMAAHADGWFGAFGGRVVTSSDVAQAKPAPDIFLAACALFPPELAITPADCVVIEDSPAGLTAARAAGMRAVALVTEGICYEAVAPDERLASLYALDPARWGLPPFTDHVGGTVSLGAAPLRFVGPVARGFGRGSKELGIPTANLAAEGFVELLGATSCGIYHGFAQVGGGPVFKMCTSIGRNPYYGE
jgi:HAD superfamily hydrolase (TIGR01509 family)